MAENMQFSLCGINCVFSTDAKGRLVLLHMAPDSAPVVLPEYEAENTHYQAIEIQAAGFDDMVHRGAKQVSSYVGGPLKYCSHEILDTADGKRLVFTLKSEAAEVNLSYRFYNDFTAVHTDVTVKNISEEAVGLCYVAGFCLTCPAGIRGAEAQEKARVYIPHNAWCRELTWKDYSLQELGVNMHGHYSTKRIALSNSGAWSTKEYLPMGALVDKTTKQTIMWQIEHNGSWSWELSDLPAGLYLRTSGPNEVDHHWYKEIAAGESFEAVGATVAFSESGFDAALEVMNSYRRTIYYTNDIEKKLPVIFNDYMGCLNADPTTEKLLPIIDVAADCGAEIFCMDAGWYADEAWDKALGKWVASKTRFPNGMKEVFDHIREKGMIGGIWVEIEAVAVSNENAEKFPDSWFFTRHGKRVSNYGRYQLDFRNPEVRAYADSVLDGLINDYGIGYFKIDYNMDPSFGTDYNADSAGDGLLEHNRAYLEWVRGVYARHPNLIIENCASGGMRMDYASLANHTVQSLTDASSFGRTSLIACAAATAVLPEQASMWCVPKEQHGDCEIAGHMVNAMALRMMFSGETHKLSDAQRAIVKEGVECYKSIRAELTGSQAFYPLGLPEYSDKNLAVGYKLKNGKLLLQVWRLEGGESEIEITLPKTATAASLLYPSCSNAKISIAGDKVAVTLPEETSAAIFEII